MTGERVASVSPTRVTLKSGTVLNAHTLVWGAGLQGEPLAQLARRSSSSAATESPSGRTSSLAGHPEVFAVGDIGCDHRRRRRRGAAAARLRRAPVRRARRRDDRAPGRRARRPSRSPTATRGRWRRSAAAPRSSRCSRGRTMKGKTAQLAWGTVHLALLLDGRGPCEGGRRLDVGGVSHQRVRPHHGARPT